ncbi:MAG: hypothetical protein ACE5F5_05180, partial [Acidimicrobiia bacterium]
RYYNAAKTKQKDSTRFLRIFPARWLPRFEPDPQPPSPDPGYGPYAEAFPDQYEKLSREPDFINFHLVKSLE